MQVVGYVNPFPNVGCRGVEEGEASQVRLQQKPKRGGIRPVPAPTVLLPEIICVCNREGTAVHARFGLNNDKEKKKRKSKEGWSGRSAKVAPVQSSGSASRGERSCLRKK
jgi:hypothetical protein